MDYLAIFERLGLAIAIGAVVGVERHWRERDEAEGQRTAGLRTFTLIGMLGGVAGLIAAAMPFGSAAASLFIVGVFASMSGALILFQYREAVAEGTFSVTSTIAGMLTYVLGVMATVGDPRAASAGSVALVSILASREILHSFMRRLTWAELRSAIVLLAMTFVILPLIPKTPIGPFGGISPSATWLLVIILATISYSGYVAVKLLGSTRGELVAGAVGGLVASTAITVTNAQGSNRSDNPRSLAAGAAAACSVSYGRTAALVWALAPQLALSVVPAFLSAAGVMIGAAALLARGDDPGHEAQQPKNPFDLRAIVVMTLALVAIGFAARAGAEIFGDKGLIVVTFLSGLADVDAAVVTVADMAPALSAGAASVAIAAAVASNTLAKAFYALVLGKAAFSLPFVVASAIALAAGAVVYGISAGL